MERKIISIRDDFSRYPAGRFRSDGNFSGERFRDDLLYPELKAAAKRIIVKLDGTLGYGSSFLEEAFGGLVRRHRLSAHEIKKYLVLESNDPTLVTEIWHYIDTAKPN